LIPTRNKFNLHINYYTELFIYSPVSKQCFAECGSNDLLEINISLHRQDFCQMCFILHALPFAFARRKNLDETLAARGVSRCFDRRRRLSRSAYTSTRSKTLLKMKGNWI
jgi:hypothetical protein